MGFRGSPTSALAAAWFAKRPLSNGSNRSRDAPVWGDILMVSQDSTPQTHEGSLNMRRWYQKGSLQKRKHRRFKVWAALWWQDGHRRYRTLGRCSAMSQGEARLLLDAIRSRSTERLKSERRSRGIPSVILSLRSTFRFVSGSGKIQQLAQPSSGSRTTW